MWHERQPGAEERDEQPVRASAAPEAPHAILTLQRSAGNAAVARWLARQPTVTTPAAQSSEYDTARAELDTFVKAGKKGPVTYNPSDRNPANYYGGFDVAYDPALQQLDVIVKGAIEYLPGIILKSGLAQAKEESAEARTAADAINALPAADRAAEVKKWQWSKGGGPDADDEKTFLEDFKSTVTTTWQGKHPFHCTKKYWEDLGAETKIDIQITESTTQAAADHMKVNAFKVPKAKSITKAGVKRTDTTKGAHGNTLTMNSSSVKPKASNMLVYDIGFDPGASTLTTAAKATLAKLGGEMPNAPAGATIAADDITAKVQGADDAKRQARFTAVRDALTATGMAAGRVKFEAAGTGDGATVVVGDGRNRTSAAHEMGHMFGYDDEYTGADDYAPGKKTEHTDFVDKAGFKGAQHARSDSIMSSGTNVRPQHYATFLDALKIVSGMTDWEYGKPRLVVDPAKIGDFPLGGPGGTAPATPPDTRHA